MRAEQNQRGAKIQGFLVLVRIDDRHGAVMEDLHHAREAAQPGGGFLPTRACEQAPEKAVMHCQRSLRVAQPRLVRIGPQKLIRRAEGATQQKMIVRKPALQDLAAGCVAVICHHSEFGGAG